MFVVIANPAKEASMSAPVIRSVTPSRDTVAPGESFQVVVDAYDPDARVLSITGTATDSTGQTVIAKTSVTVGDPLTFELSSDDDGVTISQDPANPGNFTVTVA